MKHFLSTIAIIVLFGQSLSAQVVMSKKFRKTNSYGIEFYSPISTPGLEFFYNEDWLLTEVNQETDFNRTSFNYGIGFVYEKSLENNLNLRARFGYSGRTIRETSNSTSTANGERNDFDLAFNYDQSQLNLFVAATGRIPLTKRFFIDLGLEIPYIYYFSSTSFFSQINTLYRPNSSEVFSKTERSFDVDYGDVHLVGIGPAPEVNFMLSDHFYLSFELQSYLMLTRIATTTFIDEEINDLLNADATFDDSEFDSVLRSNVTQISWSRLSPLFRIQYLFWK